MQIIWPKIKYLSSSIKLSPWYLQGRALAAIETTAGNTSAQVAASYTASFPANATLDGPSAMLQAFAADSATSTEAIATTVSSFSMSGSCQYSSKGRPAECHTWLMHQDLTVCIPSDSRIPVRSLFPMGSSHMMGNLRDMVRAHFMKLSAGPSSKDLSYRAGEAGLNQPHSSFMTTLKYLPDS